MVRRYLCGQLALANNYQRVRLTKSHAINVTPVCANASSSLSSQSPMSSKVAAAAIVTAKVAATEATKEVSSSLSSSSSLSALSTSSALSTFNGRFYNSVQNSGHLCLSVKASQSLTTFNLYNKLSSTASSLLSLVCRNLNTDAPRNVVTFNLADIGEGISEVIIKEWFVKEGDKVAQFDAICEVQSDKASVTITSRYDGFVHKIYYEVDDIANVGKPLIDIRLEGSPDTGISEIILDQSSTKISTSGTSIEPQVQAFEDEYSISSKILTTPAVRRLAMEHKINLKDVTGTGKEGRILKEDVLNYITMSEQKPVISSTISTKLEVSTKPVEKVQPIGEFVRKNVLFPSDRSESIKGITKSMFKTMTQSLQVPHFGLSDEIDLTSLVNLKPELKKIGNDMGISISYMPFMIKAASLALNDFPILNAQIDKASENIVYKGSHNIGVAMDTKKGLLVPNIKGVNGLTVVEIAQELNRLHQMGKAEQLGTNDLSGGTFTLSNIGSVGGLFGIPVLMPSEVAIGAIGKTIQVPRFVDENSDQVRRAHIVHVLWSADHRIIDGATMTRFNNRFKTLLENPIQILLS